MLTSMLIHATIHANIAIVKAAYLQVVIKPFLTGHCHSSHGNMAEDMLGEPP